MRGYMNQTLRETSIKGGQGLMGGVEGDLSLT